MTSARLLPILGDIEKEIDRLVSKLERLERDFAQAVWSNGELQREIIDMRQKLAQADIALAEQKQAHREALQALQRVLYGDAS